MGDQYFAARNSAGRNAIITSRVFICTRYMRSKPSSPVTAGAFSPARARARPVSAPNAMNWITATMATNPT